MLIKLNTFKGQNKKVPVNKLPAELGQKAINTYIEDDTLTPMYTDAVLDMGAVSVPTSTDTIYKHRNINTGNSEWVFFDDFIHLERHPVGSDVYQRLYFIQNNKLKHKRYGSATIYDTLLGQPNPQDKLIINKSIGAGDANIQRFIAYTLVTSAGEETALSLTTTGTGNYKYGNYQLTGLTEDSSIMVYWNPGTIVPTGGSNETYTMIRFYVTPTSTVSTEYKFIKQAMLTDGVGGITITDIGNDTALLDAIDSPVRLTYDNYSTVSLKGVCKTTFGSLLIWDKASIYVSDVHHPYRYSSSSVYSLDEEIVSVHPFGNSFFVTTKGSPYILTGTSPDSLTYEKAEGARGCIKQDCVVDLGNFICVPTDDGIYTIGTGTFALGTEMMFSSKSWKEQTLYGNYLYSATQYKNLYLLNLTTNKTLVFDFINGFFWELDYNIQRGYYDPIDQILYYRNSNTSSSELLMFNEGTIYRQYTYKTGRLDLSAPTNFKYLRVNAESYTGGITIKLYDKGTLKFTRIVTTDAPIKLPSGLYSEIELEIIASVVITDIYVSHTIEEMIGA